MKGKGRMCLVALLTSLYIFDRGEVCMAKKENQFQSELIKAIKKEFPGSIVLKNDPRYIQGIPDLIILFGRFWAALEVKRSEKAKHRPNQDYWVDKMNGMSYASFVYPKNKEEVINALEKTFTGANRKPRISKCKQIHVA